METATQFPELDPVLHLNISMKITCGTECFCILVSTQFSTLFSGIDRPPLLTH